MYYTDMPIGIRHQETRKTAKWASSVGESRYEGRVAQSVVKECVGDRLASWRGLLAWKVFIAASKNISESQNV
jgi:hypothetical protein